MNIYPNLFVSSPSLSCPLLLRWNRWPEITLEDLLTTPTPCPSRGPSLSENFPCVMCVGMTMR